MRTVHSWTPLDQPSVPMAVPPSGSVACFRCGVLGDAFFLRDSFAHGCSDIRAVSSTSLVFVLFSRYFVPSLHDTPPLDFQLLPNVHPTPVVILLVPIHRVNYIYPTLYPLFLDHRTKAVSLHAIPNSQRSGKPARGGDGEKAKPQSTIPAHGSFTHNPPVARALGTSSDGMRSTKPPSHRPESKSRSFNLILVRGGKTTRCKPPHHTARADIARDGQASRRRDLQYGVAIGHTAAAGHALGVPVCWWEKKKGIY
ncbi:hypothetical protein PAPYR_9525 [Paratrimastix pyriformis]|uniref:Uncharacterized protein n=1 Tax=Paratrimastix pyriformis TaxID=342808 RepID=A0ABQ8U843_9EUKA|nr:hypothetical protein PAPYR_9525 [Paratrimastix pyriformis]